VTGLLDGGAEALPILLPRSVQVSPIEWLPPLHSQVVFDSRLVAAPFQLWVVDSPILCAPVFLSQVVFESHLVAAQVQLLVVESWSVWVFTFSLLSLSTVSSSCRTLITCQAVIRNWNYQ